MDLYYLKYRGVTFPVPPDETVIGRSPSRASLVLSGERVSRAHAQVFVTEEGLFVEDLGSRNGTYVNGRRISKPTRLESGDVLAIGDDHLEIWHEQTRDTEVTLHDATEDEDDVATAVERNAVGLLEELVARAAETGERQALIGSIREMLDAIVNSAEKAGRTFGRNEVARLETVAGLLAGWVGDGSLDDWRADVTRRLEG